MKRLMVPRLNAAGQVARVYGILVGFAGIEHGVFEILQENKPTVGLMIEAIGPGQCFWESGGQDEK